MQQLVIGRVAALFGDEKRLLRIAPVARHLVLGRTHPSVEQSRGKAIQAEHLFSDGTSASSAHTRGALLKVATGKPILLPALSMVEEHASMT